MSEPEQTSIHDRIAQASDTLDRAILEAVTSKASPSGSQPSNPQYDTIVQVFWLWKQRLLARRPEKDREESIHDFNDVRQYNSDLLAHMQRTVRDKPVPASPENIARLLAESVSTFQERTTNDLILSEFDMVAESLATLLEVQHLYLALMQSIAIQKSGEAGASDAMARPA